MTFSRSIRPPEPTPDETRRLLMQAIVLLPAAALVGCAGESVAAPSAASSSSTTTSTTTTSLPVTPSCADGDDDPPTPSQTEGPYFTPNSPLRASLLESGLAGTRLSLSGLVLTTSCQPIANALLDFWQADDGGNYDNTGYTLRGHQFTDAAGRFSLETIVPGLYPGRTRHIHVKVQKPGGAILTTQLYFPGEARNATDGIYAAALLMAITDGADGTQGAFDFVLA